MEIRIEPHTLIQALKRGVSADEIREVLRDGIDSPAKHGRNVRSLVHEFGGRWKGRRYAQKRVEAIYTVENCVMITVTVYCYYGDWRVQP